MLNTQPVDLTNCDREPIHIPGSVQPHGCLVACDASAETILRHSANAPAMFGLSYDFNGKDLTDLVDRETAHDLRNALLTASDPSRPALLFDVEIGSGRFDIAIHRHLDTTIVEFEPAGKDSQPLELARALIGRIGGLTEVDGLVRKSARLVRGMLGYDRVMIYRFEQDGAGKVFAEEKRSDLESFLGQYFPASDIPQQARALYLRNTIRTISDIDYKPVLLVPEIDGNGEPLDLSFAHLRSVSPIHCEYLRNMGVSASMSISIVVDGRLWGLIACHHYSPKILSMAARVAAEMFGEFFSLNLQTLKQRGRIETAARARGAIDRFLRLATHHGDIHALLRDSLAEFEQLMPCDGIGLCINGQWSGRGAVPPQEFVPELVSLVGRLGDLRVWSADSLSVHMPEAAGFCDRVSGVLAIPLSQISQDYLFFFRKEMVQTLNWAGNPEKSYETGPHGDRLTPRKSFDIWKETVHRQAQPWTEGDREIAEAARSALVEVVLHHSELMAEERQRYDVRQRMLNEELNHRVKNILAVIKSLVGQPVEEGRSLKEFIASLRGRIQALSYAHDQVVRSDGGGFLRDLLQAELGPYGSSSERVVLDGPPLWMDARAFSVMALVLHELATNASKYGALSSAAGRLNLRWWLDEAGVCHIEWRESGGPPVTPPSRNGFGTVLIDRSIPHDLGGTSSVSYDPHGVSGDFTIPAGHVKPVETDSRQRAKSEQPPLVANPRAVPANLDILLVEDQMLIAMDVESMLAEQGLSQIRTANSVDEALRSLKSGLPQFAVLDVNLGDGTSVPVAETLRQYGVPFVFATGYGDHAMIPPDFTDVPVVRKPYEGETLVSAIASLMVD